MLSYCSRKGRKSNARFLEFPPEGIDFQFVPRFIEHGSSDKASYSAVIRVFDDHLNDNARHEKTWAISETRDFERFLTFHSLF